MPLIIYVYIYCCQPLFQSCAKTHNKKREPVAPPALCEKKRIVCYFNLRESNPVPTIKRYIASGMPMIIATTMMITVMFCPSCLFFSKHTMCEGCTTCLLCFQANKRGSLGQVASLLAIFNCCTSHHPRHIASIHGFCVQVLA